MLDNQKQVSILIGLAVLVVAAIGGLVSYSMAQNLVTQLQQQNYQYWMDASFSSSLPPHLLVMGGSAWITDQPGHYLGIAFVAPPLGRGLDGFIGIAAAGLGMMVARHINGTSRPQTAAALVSLSLLGFGLMGIILAFQPLPPTVTLDLANQSLKSGGIDVALPNVNGFGINSHGGLHSSHDTDLFVQDNGTSINLVTFSYASDAQTVQAALQNFLASGGEEL